MKLSSSAAPAQSSPAVDEGASEENFEGSAEHSDTDEVHTTEDMLEDIEHKPSDAPITATRVCRERAADEQDFNAQAPTSQILQGLTKRERMAMERKRIWRERFRKRTITGWGRWSDIAQSLEGIVAPRRSRRNRVIYVPTGALVVYTGSERSNTWIEHIGTGVQVRTFARVGDTPHSMTRRHTTRVQLRGSPVQIDIVEGKLLGLNGPHRAFDTDAGLRAGDQTADNVEKRRRAGGKLKSIDSIRGFHKYICRFTARQKNDRHEKRIVKDVHQYNALRLVTMFSDPRLSKFANTASLDRALTYIGTRPELRGAANRIYAHGWRMGLVNNIHTLNLRLRFALKHSLVGMAKSIVQDMQTLQVPANSATWSLLYYASNSTEQTRIAKMMDSKNVKLTIQARGRLALSHIEQRMQYAANDFGKWKELIRDMDASFGGRSWLTATTLKQSLHLAKRLHMHEVFEHLTELAWEHDSSHIFEAHVHCFHYFRSRKDLTRAVHFLKGIVERRARVIHWALVIPAIYMTAWEQQATNVCRILWTFAAAQGILTRTMKTMLINYLYPDMKSDEHIQSMSEGKARTEAWRRVCAQAVSGIDAEYFQQIRADYPRLLARHPDAASHVDMTAESSSDELIKAEQTALIKAIHHRDSLAWRKYQNFPPARLVSALIKAQESDLAWMKSGKTFGMSAQDARKETMTLPLKVQTEKSLQRMAKREEAISADAAEVGAEMKVERPRSMRHLNGATVDAKVDLLEEAEKVPDWAS